MYINSIDFSKKVLIKNSIQKFIYVNQINLSLNNYLNKIEIFNLEKLMDTPFMFIMTLKVIPEL